jgi:hypothetical protein
MKHDPGMHIGMHLVFFGKSGVTILVLVVNALQFCSKGLMFKSLSGQLFCNLSTFHVAHASHAVKVEPDILSMTIPKTYMSPNCSCIAHRQVVDVRETRHIIYDEF